MKRAIISCGIAIALASLLVTVAAAAMDARPRVLGGGGGTSSSANRTLSATVGQPAPIGVASASGKTLQGGFWYGTGPELLDCGTIAEAGDPDADELENADEVSAGTDRCDDDTDGDRCDDGEESVTVSPSFGGDRDPLDPWDFFDVNGDAEIELSDAFAILAKFGLLPGNNGYDALFDRYAPIALKPWRSAQATEDHVGIDLADVLTNLGSFGHSCSGPP